MREAALQVLKDEIDMKNIHVLATTSPLPNWPIAWTKKGNQTLALKVRQLLLDFDDKNILRSSHIRGFRAANEQELEELKKY